MLIQTSPIAFARRLGLAATVAAALVLGGASGAGAAQAETGQVQTLHKSVKVQGLDIFYREAGRKDVPTILLCTDFQRHRRCFET